MNLSTNMGNRIEQLRAKIRGFEYNYGRNPGSVSWVAVSKGQSVETIVALSKAGQPSFAENYLQETIPKIQQVKAQKLHLEWHFIGRLQTNKLRAIAQYFDWVQTIESLKHAHLLNQYRSHELPPLHCCMQITLKESIMLTPDQLQSTLALAVAINQLKYLSLRGVMCMIPPLSQLTEQRKYFAICRSVYEYIKQDLPNLDTLSMGMSGDFEAAIAEGATLLRIGTALFGPRNSTKRGVSPVNIKKGNSS